MPILAGFELRRYKTRWFSRYIALFKVIASSCDPCTAGRDILAGSAAKAEKTCSSN